MMHVIGAVYSHLTALQHRHIPRKLHAGRGAAVWVKPPAIKGAEWATHMKLIPIVQLAPYA